MTTNNSYLSTYFCYKTSLLIKRISYVLSKENVYLKNYAYVCLATKVYGIHNNDTIYNVMIKLLVLVLLSLPCPPVTKR